MHLENATPLAATYLLAVLPSGHRRLVVVVKGTFDFPQKDPEAPATPADRQHPLTDADIFSGEPGLSAPLYESDLAVHKPACDLILLGSAHPPAGRPTPTIPVALQITPAAASRPLLRKTFHVLGPRRWHTTFGIRPSAPEPIHHPTPVTYDTAFGGTDPRPGTPPTVATFLENPIGVGYHPHTPAADLHGRLLPNTEDPSKPIASPRATYRPLAFGPIGRNWQPRVRHVGTYGEAWLRDTFPFLPADYDDRHNQAAPPDQQLPYPTGGEAILLENLTPGGITRLRLPTLDLPIELTRRDGPPETHRPNLDTILIEPDHRRLLLTWRTSFPIRRTSSELRELIIGRMPPAFYRARAAGKRFVRSLRELDAIDRDD